MISCKEMTDMIEMLFGLCILGMPMWGCSAPLEMHCNDESTKTAIF